MGKGYRASFHSQQFSFWNPAQKQPPLAAVFGLQSGEFAPKGRELSALKLILRTAVPQPLPILHSDKNAIEVLGFKLDCTQFKSENIKSSKERKGARALP